MTRVRLALALIGFASLPALAQEAPAGAAEHAASTGFSVSCPEPSTKTPGPADIIMPHLVDAKHMEIPWPCSMEHWGAELNMPTWNVHIGGLTLDVGPTKHVVFMLLAAGLILVMFTLLARAHERASREFGHPKGFAGGLEGVILLLRDEIYMPVLGHGGEKYVPFCLTLFFFIYVCNVLGLMPYGSTATGNVSVTAGLAIITFFVVEIAGMRTLGKGYISTIVYWPHDDMNIFMKVGLSAIMSPVELIGKFTKPFALTIRLFANMVAGHVIILALIGLIFMFGALVSPPALAMALFIMFLELLVTLIQAFVFSLLAAVFIGQIRTAHH